MEGLISDRLKHYSYFRLKNLENAFTTLPAFQNSVVFHSTIIMTTLAIVVVVFSETKSLTLFSLHPICMSIGSLIFLAEGIVAYRNSGLLDTLSPIMQHNKRTKVRSIHQSMQMIGGAFLGLGMLIIVAHKIEFNKSIVPFSIHSSVGCFALLLIVVQVVTGQQKLHQMDVSNSKIRRWHGDAGLLIWDVLCVSIFTGLASFVSFGISSVLVELSVAAVWFAVHAQMSGLRPSSARAGSAGAELSDSDGPNNIDNDFVDHHVESADTGGFGEEEDLEQQEELLQSA